MLKEVDVNFINDLVLVDIESEHQNQKELNYSKKDFIQKLQKRFSEGYEKFYAYFESNEIIGYASVKPFFPGHKHCELYWMAVRKSHQGKGIGSKILTQLENIYKNEGFRKICLYTGKNMEKTRKFYEKNGYTFINEFPDYYGYEKGETTAVLYYKKLK